MSPGSMDPSDRLQKSVGDLGFDGSASTAMNPLTENPTHPMLQDAAFATNGGDAPSNMAGSADNRTSESTVGQTQAAPSLRAFNPPPVHRIPQVLQEASSINLSSPGRSSGAGTRHRSSRTTGHNTGQGRSLKA